MSIRVLIANDHGIVREGLRMYLQWDGELEVIGETTDAVRRLTFRASCSPISCSWTS